MAAQIPYSRIVSNYKQDIRRNDFLLFDLHSEPNKTVKTAMYIKILKFSMFLLFFFKLMRKIFPIWHQKYTSVGFN